MGHAGFSGCRNSMKFPQLAGEKKQVLAPHISAYLSLVGDFKPWIFMTVHFTYIYIYGMSSFPLTFIFFKMVKTINQHLKV